MSDMSTLCK